MLHISAGFRTKNPLEAASLLECLFFYHENLEVRRRFNPFLHESGPDLSVSSKGWQSQQEINLPGQKSEPGNLSNSVASDQNIEAY